MADVYRKLQRQRQKAQERTKNKSRLRTCKFFFISISALISNESKRNDRQLNFLSDNNLH